MCTSIASPVTNPTSGSTGYTLLDPSWNDYTAIEEVKMFDKANRAPHYCWPGDRSIPQEWYDGLAQLYRAGDRQMRLLVISTVIAEASCWDAIARSTRILPEFEKAIGKHVCALWETCDETHSMPDALTLRRIEAGHVEQAAA